MIIRRHKISAEAFVSLAGGEGGPSAVQYLADVEYSKHLLLVHGVVATSRQCGHPQHGRARQAYDLLAAIQEQAPDEVETVLRYPSVGAWAGRTVLALQDGHSRLGAEPAGLALLAAAAAVRSHFPCVLEVPAAAGLITLPSLGQVVLSGLPAHAGSALLRSGLDGAEVISRGHYVRIPQDRQSDAPGWRGLRLLIAQSDGKSLRLLIDGLDPFRIPAPSLGAPITAEEAEIWQLNLQQAWELLVRNHRITADEILASISVLTPLDAPTHGQVSATSRETFGCVGLSAPVDPLTLAVTLAHEVQHAKLSAMLDTVSLIYPDDATLYYAPWRDDPRPVSALLQGAYAYLGVTGFWRRQRREETGTDAIRAHTEFSRWRSAVSAVVRTIQASGRLTSTGEAFVAGMSAAVRSHCDEPIPEEAEELARRDARRHAELWRLRHDRSVPPGIRT
jgi:HEXXH motif-containing protein